MKDMDFIMDIIRLNLAYTYGGDVSTYSRMGEEEIIQMVDNVFKEHRADRDILGKLEEHLRERFVEAS